MLLLGFGLHEFLLLFYRAVSSWSGAGLKPGGAWPPPAIAASPDLGIVPPDHAVPAVREDVHDLAR